MTVLLTICRRRLVSGPHVGLFGANADLYVDRWAEKLHGTLYKGPNQVGRLCSRTDQKIEMVKRYRALYGSGK
jgi:hypothetical protein